MKEVGIAFHANRNRPVPRWITCSRADNRHCGVRDESHLRRSAESSPSRIGGAGGRIASGIIKTM